MSLEQHRAESEGRLRFAVLTFSDTRDAQSDRGGAYLAERLAEAGHDVTWRELVSDAAADVQAAVRRAVARADVDLVLTTGGTGVAPRDQAYDALRGLFDSDIPGFGELFRWLSYQEIGSAALLSRAVGGLLAGKVVLALPGSPKALRLALDEIVLREAGHLVSQTTKT
ncbi:MAG: molybdenum cofactor biosynthesis protein MoaB [Planctomycetes bacterium]|nr:molybdenum cofactor biosynthesis protein MoaB [Planctomycetota bacterium]